MNPLQRILRFLNIFVMVFPNTTEKSAESRIKPTLVDAQQLVLRFFVEIYDKTIKNVCKLQLEHDLH